MTSYTNNDCITTDRSACIDCDCVPTTNTSHVVSFEAPDIIFFVSYYFKSYRLISDDKIVNKSLTRNK